MATNPSITTTETYSDRKILAFPGFAGPVISVLLAANQGDLLAGTVLGKITASGKYAPVRRTTLSADVAAGQTDLSVADPDKFLVGQVVSIQEADGSEVENLGAITAVNAAQGVISVTTGLTAAKSTGAYIYVNDGSETARVILNEPVLNQHADVNVEALLGGVFYSSQLIGIDSVSRSDLGARVVDGYTIVPV